MESISNELLKILIDGEKITARKNSNTPQFFTPQFQLFIALGNDTSSDENKSQPPTKFIYR
mgnify:CR=1 FL=1